MNGNYLTSYIGAYIMPNDRSVDNDFFLTLKQFPIYLNLLKSNLFKKHIKYKFYESLNTNYI